MVCFARRQPFANGFDKYEGIHSYRWDVFECSSSLPENLLRTTKVKSAGQGVFQSASKDAPHPTLRSSFPHLSLKYCKPHGRMPIQAEKSITLCPQLVSVRLIGLEMMLSFSLNMSLSLPTSKGFTCLTAIFAVVVELARHFTMPRSVLAYEEASTNFEKEWLKRVANNLVSS
ncbi:hypothetical protein AVEN_28708-1 [Araneus ventricosus]|uniref:Uncharacterized protein n=1 Tax=Araneus ventricosus TaxID=182803 RepID=A0A4Y2J3B3_ARAVE|nr:hypothetical protein AVEN_28708-1 [Araneus ventricosus]